MTEAQFNYLADLAAQKGVVLQDTDDKSVAWASKKIEELKALPDAEFREITPEEDAEIDRLIDHAREELHKWTFTR